MEIFQKGKLKLSTNLNRTPQAHFDLSSKYTLMRLHWKGNGKTALNPNFTLPLSFPRPSSTPFLPFLPKTQRFIFAIMLADESI